MLVKQNWQKLLAEAIFGSEDNMIRVDMSEFMEKHSTAKLIGSPPGYVGYDDGGHLSELVRKKPYSVILLTKSRRLTLMYLISCCKFLMTDV